MAALFKSEFYKLRKSSIWLLIFVSPLLSFFIGLLESNEVPQYEGVQWVTSLGMMTIGHAILFLPLLTGVFASFVCRYEHAGGGWKQLLTMPVHRGNIYIAKMLLVALLIGLTQLLFVVALLVIGWIKGFPGDIPWDVIGSSIAGGWLACMPLLALQLFVSVAWSSFAAPLAINVIFTIPNILIINSERFGPYYPWAQPFLLMMPDSSESFGALNTSATTLFIVIIGGFVVFFLAGLFYFKRKEI
ncbi:hypothetical protein HNO89_000214 [Sporosarcina luteola]|nr:hypothetical protein [Sporosarcina luteola]